MSITNGFVCFTLKILPTACSISVFGVAKRSVVSVLISNPSEAME